MAGHFREMLARSSKVSLKDVAISATRANNGLIPSNGADTSHVSVKVADKSTVLSVPNLRVA